MNRWFKEMSVLGLATALIGILVIVPEETVAKEQDVLVLAHAASMTSLDPASSNIGAFVMMYRNLFQGLLRHKFNSTELEGDLAKSWSSSKDGLVYTFKLRDDIRWHKGFGKVTAHDVKFSFDRIMDPKTRSVFMGEVIQTVKEVKVVDDLTVEVHLKDRDVTFLQRCARPKPVAIVCQKAVEKYGTDFARNPIGSGPFVFQSMSREEVVLTANKEYFEGSPKIEKVIYKTIPDQDTRTMSLMKGEINFIWDFPADQALVDRIRTAGCMTKFLDHGAWMMLLLNPRVEPLGDLRVRRAIAHAIDKDEIINHVFVPGAVDRLESLVPKGYFGHTEEGLRRYNFDPQKARELLAEAGYPNGFEVLFESNNTTESLILSPVIQNQLAKVGIKAKLAVMDLPSSVQKVSGGTATMTIFMPARIPDADSPLTSFFHSASSTPGLNLARYNKLDREIEEARRESDQTKRVKMYHEIQEKLMEDLPAIPLFDFKWQIAYRPGIVGFPDKSPVWGIDFYHLQFMR